MAEKQTKPSNSSNSSQNHRNHNQRQYNHHHHQGNQNQSRQNNNGSSSRPSSSYRPKPQAVVRPERTLSSTSTSDKICCVCYKDVTYYSVGSCEHSVCYECSSRMRILMEQNECPICRKVLEDVVFTEGMKSHAEVQDKIRMYIFLPKYGIYLENDTIKAALDSLLEHKCLRCSEHPPPPTFPDFQSLNQHMQRNHELFSCTLCVEHIKLFPGERKFYTRSDLAFHKRKGDRGDTSHRGHPLCKFCDKRFFDTDDLYKHLRQDHFFCHFCDADGYNHYYNDYEELRLHFRKEHFLCEEEHCAEERFTNVFRSEIDLKAHLASAHSKLLGKQGMKQARALELEFAMAPRPENERGRFGKPIGGNRDRDRRGGGGGRDRDGDIGLTAEEENFIRDSQVPQVPIVPIKIDSAKDFPTLDGSQASGGVGPSVPPHSSTNGASIAQKVALKSGMNVPIWNAKTKREEDFPALDGSVPKSSASGAGSSQFLLSRVVGQGPQERARAQQKPKNLTSPEEEFPSLPTSTSNKVWNGSGPTAKMREAPKPKPKSKKKEVYLRK